MSNYLKLLLLFAIAATACDTTYATNAQVTSAAKQFASDLYGAEVVKGASCVRKDSDADGYLSCSVSIKEGETAPVKILNLECAYIIGGGCKTRMPKNSMMPVQQ